jgi:O-acetylhomoserine (thiol)-lyase
VDTARAFGFSTRAIHAGAPPDPASGARALPITLSTSYVFESAAEAAELFALRSYGHIYSRISNPTVSAFEERMASLEGGLGAVATASGHAAQFCAVLALAGEGDHIVSSTALYGGTRTQFGVTLRRLGITTTFVDPDDLDGLRAAAARPSTRALYCETIGNPGGHIPDLGAWADIAHSAGVPLVVDSTFATPYLCRPGEWGADIVIHSATKYIGGHGTVVGGVVVDTGSFDFSGGTHPLLSDPSPGYHDLVFSETFGEYAFLTRLRAEVLRDVGATMSPMNAWLLLQGLETLPLRMDRHCENALTVARWLEARPEVAWVSYPGLPSHPCSERAQRFLGGRPGAIFSFGLAAGRDAGIAFIERLQLWSHLANVGDAKSLVIHPASTTHSQWDDEELRAGGVPPEAIRLSVGLEDVDDLIWDLEAGLSSAVTGAAP